MPPYIVYIILGVSAGVLSGMIGVGGGILLVPAFVYFLGMTQHQAQGTTLALFIPPIGILGVYVYYREGNVDLTVAAFVCLGFVFGSLFGAQIANAIDKDLLRRIFGAILLLVSLKMLFQK